MASSYVGEGLDWILGIFFSLEGWSKIETGCAGHGEITLRGMG